jgi:hypothetical protein
LLSCFVAHAEPAVAAAAAEPVPEAEPRPWVLGARLGYAGFIRSRSLALQHLFKPSVQLSAARRVLPRLDVGMALGAVLDTDDNYGVWGAYALGRYTFVRASSLQLAAHLALGVGHDAPILHDDLRASALLLPYASLGIDVSWRLTDDVSLGLELANETLGVMHLGVVTRWCL